MAKIKTFEDFINKASIKHNNKYDYNKTQYIDRLTKIEIICPVHGVFTQRPSDHLAGCGCKECGKIKIKHSILSTTDEFIKKAKVKHGDKYTYNKVDYQGAKTKVLITCPHHGDFKQTPNDHLSGCGCRHCRTENIGWNDTKWKEHGQKSPYFTGYKVYIAKIWDGNESFFKIGKTFVDASNRFKDIAMYYSYQILDTIEGDADTMCKLERKYQRMNKEYKYEPAIAFSGHTECFSKVIVEGKIYE